ncbi:MAG: L,D-transpeptidase family protein [Verrucomicrobiota bacterium]
MASPRPSRSRRAPAKGASRKKPGAGKAAAAKRRQGKPARQAKRGLDLSLVMVVILSLFSSSAIGYFFFFGPWADDRPVETAASPRPEALTPAPSPTPAPPEPAPVVSAPDPEEARISPEEVAIMNEIATGDLAPRREEVATEEVEETVEDVIGPEGEFIGEDPALAMVDPPAVPEVAAPEEPVIRAAELATVARAQPLDPNEMTTERVAAYQVALERMHFSCGFVDGDVGMRTRRVIRAFQQSRGLPVTGELDAPTRAAIGEPGEPFTNYIVTREDMNKIVPTPELWREKAQAEVLGYNDPWEMLAEKFHCTVGYLQALNPDVTTVRVGTEVIGPKVFPAAPLRKADSIRILLAETTIQALDANGRIIAHFPCSIARNKNKRPAGELRVKNIAVNPDYTFSPDVITSVAEAEGITKKMILPPGPNNPVGTAWIGLSLPGYGMHGTPEPEDISRTQSSGCFRLSNWNATKLLHMVKPGMLVTVVPPEDSGITTRAAIPFRGPQ